MILRIDHVAIAVKEYEKALHFFQNILGAIPGAYAKEAKMKYKWQLTNLGDLSRLELLHPTGPGSFLDNFLRNKEGGVHHITMQVQDIQQAKTVLDNNKIPYFGYADYGDIWKELFIHPKDAFGVLIQLAEFRPNDWLAEITKWKKDKQWEITGTETGIQMSVAHPGGGKVQICLSKQEALQLMEELKVSLQS